MGDGIFEFADEFGVTSPFGKWVDNDFKYGSNQKSLKIKFLSCKKDDNSYYLTFEIDARNLKSSKAKIHVEESELISNEIAVPIKIVTIKPNGIQKVTVSFSKNKLFSQSIFEGGLEFIGVITCDNLSSQTDEFSLNCITNETSTPSQKLIQPIGVTCKPLNLNAKQKAQFKAVVLSETSHGFKSLWDVSWLYFSRITDMGFEKGISGSIPYTSKNINYKLWMYYLGEGDEYKNIDYLGDGEIKYYVKINGWFKNTVEPRAKNCISYIDKFVLNSKPINKYVGWYGQGYWKDLNLNPEDSKGDKWYKARAYYLLQVHGKVNKILVVMLEELNGTGTFKDQTTFIFDEIRIEQFFKNNPSKLPAPEKVKKYIPMDGKNFN